MFVTVAVIFIVLITFLLIIYNMYVDYASKKEADARLLLNRSRNVIAECEELLLNQNQLPYSKTLVLILHHRIYNCLKKLKDDPFAKDIEQRIADASSAINDVQLNYKEDLAFRPPQNDVAAVAQLREIRRLRKIIFAEMKAGTHVDHSSCAQEDRRLQLLILKVNISNLIQRVLDLKRLQQYGSCRDLIEKGLDVIRSSGIKDQWLDSKASTLTTQMRDIEREIRNRTERDMEKMKKKDEDSKVKPSELDEIFGDKKKW